MFSGGLGLETVETRLWGGLFLTLVIAGVGIVLSLPIGVMLALGRRSKLPVVSLLCTIFIEIWRGVPLITVLFMASNMFPLFMPEDIHMIPSGHKLIAYLLYNFLASGSEFNFSFSKKIIPFTQNQIHDAIIQSELPLANIVKSFPFWEFTKAMIYKNHNQFENSKLSVLRYLAMEPENPRANFQLSSLLIREGNFEKAIPYLEKLIQSKNIFQRKSRNMLALHYLIQGNMEMANFYKKGNSANKNFQNILKQQLGIPFDN